MHKLNLKNISLVVLFAFVLTACGGENEDTSGISDADLVKTQAAEIAANGIAGTAAAVALLPSDTPDEATPPTPFLNE